MVDLSRASGRTDFARQISEEDANADLRLADRETVCRAHVEDRDSVVVERLIAYAIRMRNVAGDDRLLEAGANAFLSGLSLMDRAAFALVARLDSEAETEQVDETAPNTSE